MLKGIVVRDDDKWQGHPDVALFDENVVVVFRESDRHMTQSSTKIKVTIKSPNHEFQKPYEIASTQHRFNCPRLTTIGDTLYLICDQVEQSNAYIKAENDSTKTKVLMWHTQNLKEWEGPIETGITGIVPDRICTTFNDGFLIATHTSLNKSSNQLIQNVWHADSLEGPWTQFPLCHSNELNLCEASICRLQREYICLMRENSDLGLPAYACYSRNGFEWTDPNPTRMFGCHRPVTGLLKSGNLLTTYRDASHSFRGLIEISTTAQPDRRSVWAKNTFACLTSRRDILRDMTKSIILPLDHDNNQHSDSGYTGWVQMADDSIFIVNYITADAPRPYIRWYHIHESDF